MTISISSFRIFKIKKSNFIFNNLSKQLTFIVTNQRVRIATYGEKWCFCAHVFITLTSLNVSLCYQGGDANIGMQDLSHFIHQVDWSNSNVTCRFCELCIQLQMFVWIYWSVYMLSATSFLRTYTTSRGRQCFCGEKIISVTTVNDTVPELFGCVFFFCWLDS